MRLYRHGGDEHSWLVGFNPWPFMMILDKEVASAGWDLCGTSIINVKVLHHLWILYCPGHDVVALKCCFCAAALWVKLGNMKVEQFYGSPVFGTLLFPLLPHGLSVSSRFKYVEKIPSAPALEAWRRGISPTKRSTPQLCHLAPHSQSYLTLCPVSFSWRFTPSCVAAAISSSSRGAALCSFVVSCKQTDLIGRCYS